MGSKENNEIHVRINHINQTVMKGIESLPQYQRFSNPSIFATQPLRPYICQTTQTTNSVGSNNLSLKYQRFTPSGCKDIEITKFKFVVKTQFLLSSIIRPSSAKFEVSPWVSVNDMTLSKLNYNFFVALKINF